MNESIVDLGEAIISAYYNKLNEWSALVEVTFAKDDLSASFGMVDDMLRLEDDWQEFVLLVQTLQTDYLPQDLLEASGTEALPPEQQEQSLPSVKKRVFYPLAPTVETGSPFVFPTDQEEQQAQKKIADNTNFPLSRSDFNFPEIDQASASYIENKPLSFEFPDNAFETLINDISTSSGKGILNVPWEDILNLAQNQGSLNSGESDLIPQGISIQKTEPGETNDYSASIWTTPLQNLGDFATQITYPVSKNGDEKSQPLRSVRPTENNSDRLSTYSGWLTSNEPNNQTNPGQSLLSEYPATPVLGFNNPPIPGSTNPLSQANEIIGSQPENQPFQSAIPPHTVLPDTDDLLEALTDRILRDFRRYYP